MNQSILLISPLIEDISAVCEALACFGFSVFQAESIGNAKAGLAMHSPAFLIIDLDVEEYEKIISEALSDQCNTRPYILASSSFHTSKARAMVLKLGANICIGKPLDIEEILAAIETAERRENWIMRFKHDESCSPIVYKDLKIDSFQRQVTMQGEIVNLTTKEFDILRLLAERRGTVLTKSEIYQTVWNTSVDLDASVVTIHISSIRKKLGLKCQDNDYIRTVFGVGYRFGWLDS